MAKTITLTPLTCTISNTKAGTTVADIKYTPTLSTTWVAGSAETFGEGEYNSGTTAEAQYMHIIYDDLVAIQGS